MTLQQVSEHSYAFLNEANRVCDASSGLIDLGGGVVIDTQSDLPHARQMIERLNVERAYRDLRDERPDAPGGVPAIADTIYDVATTRGVPVEY